MHHDAKPDTVRPLIIAALFIAATAAAAAFLALTHRPPGSVARVKAEPAGQVVTLPSGEKHAMASPNKAAPAVPQSAQLRRRLAFADQLERRYRARDLPVSVTVTGEDQRVFTFRWTVDPNPDQLAQMKHADPLWGELKALGFRRVEMLDQGAHEHLWYKDL